MADEIATDICPLFVIAGFTIKKSLGYAKCKKENCRWWISGYTTEMGRKTYDCAIVINAKKNSDGFIVI